MNDRMRKIISLRNEGKTYSEISKLLGINKSTISYTCNKYCGSNQDIVKKNFKKYNPLLTPEKQLKMQKKAKEYHKRKRIEAVEKWEKRIKRVDMYRRYYMAGLYDGEGNHKGTGFDITNSNSKIILFTINFLKDVDAKFKLTLYLHVTHNREKCLRFWNLPFDYIRQYDNRNQVRDYSNKENYGTIRVQTLKPLGLRDVVRNYSMSHN